ncbi:hypothetical protein PAMA_011139 [Pampus argenteus]
MAKRSGQLDLRNFGFKIARSSNSEEQLGKETVYNDRRVHSAVPECACASIFETAVAMGIKDMYKLIRTEKRPYSILVDESNDIMCEKECAILARYYSEAQDKVAVGFIDIPIFVGFLTRRHLVSEEEIPSDKTRQFFKDARSFYVRSFQKVKEKFPVRDKVLTNLSVVNPENQEDVTPEQILTLAERFPNAVKADVKEQLHLEVLDYTSTNLEKVIPNYRNLAVDEFWGRLSKVKSVNTGQVRFKELCQLIKLLLVLPNSNRDVERAFSPPHQNRDDVRCQMSHQTLVNLMSCKINKFIDIECHDLEVPGKLLKSAKQAASTYNESLKKSLEKEKE